MKYINLLNRTIPDAWKGFYSLKAGVCVNSCKPFRLSHPHDLK